MNNKKEDIPVERGKTPNMLQEEFMGTTVLFSAW